MKNLRTLCAVAVLSIMLGTQAFAGTLETPPAPAPPPDNQTGIIECPPQSQTAPTDIEFALSILQSLLATF